MPKMKTRKAIRSRIKVTGTGKLLRNQPGRRHILTKKSRKRKRQMRKQVPLHASQVKTYAKLAGY